MARYAAAIDQGTTGTRFMVFDRAGQVVTSMYEEHTQITPQPGWVEHDAGEIWAKTQRVIREVLGTGGISLTDIAAIGITNQRETTVVWDPISGEPLCNAIVWQDTRTRDLCHRLIADGLEQTFRRKTGLPIATYFSGPKLKWLLDHVPGLRGKAAAGQALFGTVDSWLIWNLTGAHVTDVTNASRTLLMNLHTLDWDDELLEILSIPRGMLPEIRPSSDSALYGTTMVDGPVGGAVPVCGDLGDQQAALFGQTCFSV
ncbi:MAG: glycerol kinase, partial [Anaerolineales bacterium]